MITKLCLLPIFNLSDIPHLMKADSPFYNFKVEGKV